MDAPTDANLYLYLEVLQRKKARYVVRACEPSYSTAPLTKVGIKVLEMSFPDGDPPPDNIVNQWLKLVEQEFGQNREEKTCIAVHCVAGLGRAPVLVAIALMEAGMDSFDAINFIRRKRRGALNARQIKYIEQYKPRSSASKKCLIM
jgi:protein tyrosine phosphatase type 4A